MTAATDLNDLLSFGFPNIALGGIHRRHPGILSVTAMTRDTPETASGMNIGSKFLHRLAETIIAKILVACHTASALLLRRGSPYGS
jgi:hypothetical protein